MSIKTQLQDNRVTVNNLQLNRELLELALWSYHRCINDLISEEVMSLIFSFVFRPISFFSGKENTNQRERKKLQQFILISYCSS